MCTILGLLTLLIPMLACGNIALFDLYSEAIRSFATQTVTDENTESMPNRDEMNYDFVKYHPDQPRILA